MTAVKKSKQGRRRSPASARARGRRATTRPRGGPDRAVEGRTPGRRERNKLDKRERIRAAAWDLFADRGFNETTTEDVAARAKVAKGTLFLYASDKSDLLHLVFHDRIREVVDARFASSPANAPLIDRLMHVFRGLFDMYADAPDVAADFVRSLPGARGPNADAMHAMTTAFLHRVAALVEDAKARGEVRDDVPSLLAAGNVFALYYGALMSWLSGFASLNGALDPGLRMALELQIRGLAK